MLRGALVSAGTVLWPLVRLAPPTADFMATHLLPPSLLVCVCVCVRARVCVCMYLWQRPFFDAPYRYVHICKYVCIYVCVCVYVHVYVCMQYVCMAIPLLPRSLQVCVQPRAVRAHLDPHAHAHATGLGFRV